MEAAILDLTAAAPPETVDFVAAPG